jgi:O-antigen/teichoic acid export membrane protein
MNKTDSTLKNIAFVAISNILKLFSSILIGFVIPNLLGVTGYGYYKVFTLYMTYVGLFHFGFIDGIYLKYAGNDFGELDKRNFRMFFRFFLSLEFIIAIIGVIISLLFIEGERKLIFILLFINLIAINSITYFQFISQITSRFKEYSMRVIILTFINIITVASMYFLEIHSYLIYTVILVSGNYFLTIWYFFTYREIIFGKKDRIRENMPKIINFFKLGIPLLLANLTGTYILILDRQIIERFFDINTYSVYAFAYSMLSMITVVVSSIGIVLYPTLSKVKDENIKGKYEDLNASVIVFVLFGLTSYFFLKWLIPLILPDYVDSLVIFRIALPGLVFTSSISAIKYNFYKISNKVNVYLYIGLTILAISLGLNILMYYTIGTTMAITWVSILSLALWYIITECYMVKTYHVNWKKNIFTIILGIPIFYVLSTVENYIFAGVLYLFLIIFITLSFHKKSLEKIYLQYKNRS